MWTDLYLCRLAPDVSKFCCLIYLTLDILDDVEQFIVITYQPCIQSVLSFLINIYIFLHCCSQ